MFPLRARHLIVVVIAAVLAGGFLAYKASTDNHPSTPASSSPSASTGMTVAGLLALEGYTLTGENIQNGRHFEWWTANGPDAKRKVTLTDGVITAVGSPDNKVSCTVPKAIAEDIVGVTSAYIDATFNMRSQTADVTHGEGWTAYGQIAVDNDGNREPYMCFQFA